MIFYNSLCTRHDLAGTQRYFEELGFLDDQRLERMMLPFSNPLNLYHARDGTEIESTPRGCLGRIQVEELRINMPECSVCAEQVDKLYLCGTCGVKLCEKDGSPEEKKCINCSENDKENREAEHEEEHEKEHEEEEAEQKTRKTRRMRKKIGKNRKKKRNLL